MSSRYDPKKGERQLSWFDQWFYGHATKGFKTYNAKAKFHCQNRNDRVFNILCYLQMIMHRLYGIAGGNTEYRIAAKGATQQLGLSSLSKDSPLRDEPLPERTKAGIKKLKLPKPAEEKLIKKLSAREDAHCLPCQITVNSIPMYDLIQPPMTSQHQKIRQEIAEMFGTVDRLPKIFNEVDSHAERVGLKAAFVQACSDVVKLHKNRGTQLDFDLVKKVYDTYASHGENAFEKCMARQMIKVKEEKPDQMVRKIKVKIADYGKRFTRSENPFFVRNQWLFRRFKENLGIRSGS